MTDPLGLTTQQEIPARLEKYFQAMTKMHASDLHLKLGQPAVFRVQSALRQTKEPPLDETTLRELVTALLSEKQLDELRRNGTVDLAWQVPDGDRFRINVFRQRGSLSIAARRVTREIPTIEQLHLPACLADIAQAEQGLILLAGATGSGKSTTIAAMIQQINRSRRCHIVTLEDPIEYLYADDKSIINQREIGIDVLDFDMALRSVLREDPDVILIGEMRDAETFRAALQASETGHLVFGTVHASTAPQTVGRILELFDSDSRHRVLQSLAFSLQAIICQKLLPSIGEGVDRVPAVEILRRAPIVEKMLTEDRHNELDEVIRSMEGQGMASFTSSLHELIHADLVDPQVAYRAAPNAEELKMRLKGITQSNEGLIRRQ